MDEKKQTRFREKNIICFNKSIDLTLLYSRQIKLTYVIKIFL